MQTDQKGRTLLVVGFIAFAAGYTTLLDSDLHLEAAGHRLIRDDIEIAAATAGVHRPGMALLVMLQNR